MKTHKVIKVVSFRLHIRVFETSVLDRLAEYLRWLLCGQRYVVVIEVGIAKLAAVDRIRWGQTELIQQHTVVADRLERGVIAS